MGSWRRFERGKSGWKAGVHKKQERREEWRVGVNRKQERREE